MWLNAVLLGCCAPVLAFTALEVNVSDAAAATFPNQCEMVDLELFSEWNQMEAPCQADDALRQLKESQEMLVRNQAGEMQHLWNNPHHEFHSLTSSHSGFEHAFSEAPYHVPNEELFGEWVQPGRLHESSLTFNEWQSEEEPCKWLKQKQYPVEDAKKDALKQLKKEQGGNVHAGEEESLDLTLLVKPRTPKDFVERWPEQKRIAQSLPRLRTPEQVRHLKLTYYPFTAAGQLLEELGKRAFLKKFARHTIRQMQESAAAEVRKKRQVERKRETTIVEVNDAGEEKVVSNIVVFVRPKTTRDFVKHWAEQKQLYLSLNYPLSYEQSNELQCTYYKFAAAGQLLEELGEKAFLDRFGEHCITRMKRTAAAEIRQRKAVEQDRATSKDDGGGTEDIVIFVRPRTPKDFVRRWSEQRRLFESLPRPVSPEQKRVLRNTYYTFTTAGRLLEELGGEAFLDKFGKGSVEQMRRAAGAEIKQRKNYNVSRGAEEIGDAGGSVEEGDSKVVVFTNPKSPEDFVRCWPEQKSRFESLPRPFTPGQRRMLDNTFYTFSIAGRLLEKLGEEEFLENFQGKSVRQMLMEIKAKTKQRGTAGEDGWLGAKKRKRVQKRGEVRKRDGSKETDDKRAPYYD